MAFPHSLDTPPLGDERIIEQPEVVEQPVQPDVLFRFAKVGGKVITSAILTAEV